MSNISVEDEHRAAARAIVTAVVHDDLNLAKELAAPFTESPLVAVKTMLLLAELTDSALSYVAAGAKVPIDKLWQDIARIEAKVDGDAGYQA